MILGRCFGKAFREKICDKDNIIANDDNKPNNFNKLNKMGDITI